MVVEHTHLPTTQIQFRRIGRYRRLGNEPTSSAFHFPIYLQISRFHLRRLIFEYVCRIRAFCRSPTFQCIRAIWRDARFQQRRRSYILSMGRHIQMPVCAEFRCRGVNATISFEFVLLLWLVAYIPYTQCRRNNCIFLLW